MQKLINAAIAFSFVTSTVVAGAGIYVSLNNEVLIEGAKQELLDSLSESLSGELGTTLMSGEADILEIPVIPFDR